MASRLFVGNLSYETTSAALASYFATCGEVAQVVLGIDPETGRPRGYADVTMLTAAGADEAVKRLDGKLFEDRPLHVIAEDEAVLRAPLARVIRRALGYVKYARDHVGAAAVSLFLFDHDTGELRGVLAEWDWTRSSFPALLSDWPTVEESLRSGEVRQITRADATGPEAGWFEPRGVDGSLCVPLRDGERRLGILFFDFDAKSRPIESADRDFLADVGQRCARAIGRAASPLEGKAPRSSDGS